MCRYTRWRQTSRQEALAAEEKLLGLCSGHYTARTPAAGAPVAFQRAQLVEACKAEQVSDVRVGPTDQHTMHTITGGPEGGTPVVMLPGYGAGAGAPCACQVPACR